MLVSRKKTIFTVKKKKNVLKMYFQIRLLSEIMPVNHSLLAGMTALIRNLSQIMKRDDFFNQEPFTDYEEG
jgi:hypothetical protein